MTRSPSTLSIRRMADDTGSSTSRQHVERVAGSRRARLTPVPGTDLDPDIPTVDRRPASTPHGESGPNDDRLMQDVPPHY